MSQENVELVREGFARWNEGDYEFFLQSTAPDVELLSRFGSLTGEPYRGHQGVREWLADIQQSFDRFDLWLDEARDLGDEVLALGGIHMRARGSGLDMNEPMGWVFEVRDGRVARMRFYAHPPTPSTPWGSGSRRCRTKTWTLFEHARGVARDGGLLETI